MRNILFNLGWNRVIVLVILLIAIIASYYTHSYVRTDSITELFGLLGLLPFAAIGFIVHLIATTSKLKKNTIGLSISARNRFDWTITKRRTVYLFVSALNLILGFSSIMYFMFLGLDQLFVFLFLTAIYLAAGSILVCIVEIIYIAKIINDVEERKSTAERARRLREEKEQAKAQLNGG